MDAAAAHRRRRSSASTDASSHRSSRRDSGEMHATLAISYTDASHAHPHTYAPPSTAVGLPPAFSYHGPTGAPPPTAQAGAHHPRSLRQADLTVALASVALEQLGDDQSHLPRSASASPAPVSPSTAGLRTYTETEDRLVLEGTEEEEDEHEDEANLRRQRRSSKRESRPSSRRRSHDPRGSSAATAFPEQRSTSDSASAAASADATAAASAASASVYPIETVEFSTTHLLPSLSSSVGRNSRGGGAPPPTAQSNGRSPPHHLAHLQPGPSQHLSASRGAITALPIGVGSLEGGHLHVREGMSGRRRSAGGLLPGLTPISAHALQGIHGDRTPITPNSAVGAGGGNAGPSIAGGSGSGRIPSQPSSGSATPVLRPSGSRARAAGRQVGQLLAPLPHDHLAADIGGFSSSVGSGFLYDHTGASQPASGASSPLRSSNSRGSGGMLPQSPGSVSALSAARAARRRSLEGLALGGGIMGGNIAAAATAAAVPSNEGGHNPRSSGGLLPSLIGVSRDHSTPSSVHNSPGGRDRFLQRPTTPYSNQASFEAVSKRRSLPPLGLSDVAEKLNETARNADD